MHENPFDRLLNIHRNEPYNDLSNTQSILSGNGGGLAEVTFRDLGEALKEITTHVMHLEDKIELYDVVFAAMFGDKEQRDAFIEYLQRHGGGRDNFEIMKLMNVLNRLKSSEKTETSANNG